MRTKTMIRGSVILLLLALWSTPIFSQIKFGVKTDVGLNNPTFSTEALKVENMTSYSIGPSVEAILPLSAVNVGLELSLLYNDNRMSVANLTGKNNGEKIEVSNRYLNLPVNVKAKLGLGGLPLKLYGAAGPYIGYLISGDKVDFQGMSDDIKAKSFQAGANIGGGLEILGMVQVGVNYSVKLTDNYSVDEPNWRDPLNGKSGSWSITASLYF
ncbi:MAG: outer membrane beta-barrel protein [Fermentimonas sp.]